MDKHLKDDPRDLLAGWQPGSGAPLYAIADAAQDKRLPGILKTGPSRCLFDYGDQTTVAEVAPHLVTLPTSPAPAWRWIGLRGLKTAGLIVIESEQGFDLLHRHLQAFLDVQVNASKSQFLAYWDPMILATLIGQPDDDTLHVKGPVFSQEQRRAFLEPVRQAWYWDRRGQQHTIEPQQLDTQSPAEPGEGDVLPLSFTPRQVRQLVQAALPDQVLYELRLNRPGVLADRSDWDNYSMTCHLLDAARELDIRGLQDLVNFVGTGMILGEDFYQHPRVSPLLTLVHEGQQSFTEALQGIAPGVLQQVMDEARARGPLFE